jgi:sterol desaturase/sphingolipid hydroxylase (fatty acid hydroxylase superfamily)
MQPRDIGALVLFAVLVIAEMIFGIVKHRNYYTTRDTLNNILLGLATTAFKTFLMVGPVYAFYQFFHNHNIVLFPDLSNYWWSWLILIPLNDMIFYWFHRLSHISRIFWASHVVHHNSEYMNLTTSVRGVFVIMSYRFLFFFPLPMIGFTPEQIILADQIGFFYQLIIHTETMKSWGFLEWFMNTPSHHRVHHASNPQYMDKNYAAIFIVWDRMFGTFEKEVEKPVYGLLHNLKSENIFWVAFHEFAGIFRDLRKSRSLSEVSGILFDHPGWFISRMPRKAFLATLIEAKK